MTSNIPPKEEVLAASNKYLTEDIRAETKDSPQYSGMAIGGFFYGFVGGLRDIGELREAYRIGGIWGVGVLRADDMIDGDHGFPAVENDSEFLRNCLEASSAGKIPEPLEYEVEKSVYAAHKILHDVVSDTGHIDEMILQLQDLYDLCLLGDTNVCWGILARGIIINLRWQVLQERFWAHY